MIFSVISSVLIIISIVFLFGLTPEQVTDDLMRLITPNDTMRDRSRNLRGNKKKHRLYRTLVKMKTALAVTGKSKQFTIVCCASLVLFAAGIIVSVLIDNIFLMPVLSVAFALIPFFYTTSTLSYYEKNTKEELETALSIITTSYVRSDDIVAAVRENIKYIKPPLRDVFKSFEGEATAISSNIKRALYKLKSMLESYAKNADREMKHELDITVADMKSGNYEAAITRLEARVGSAMMSDVCRGLIGILRGDDTEMYWASLSLKFNDIQRQQLRLQAVRVPRKVKRLSMCLLICFMLVYVVVILSQIMDSIGVLFG